MQTTTLRPGFLVSLTTSIVGNVNYTKTELEQEHLTEEGEKRAKWETERTIRDPEEHEKAVRVRSKIRQTVEAVCNRVGDHLLCPVIKKTELDEAIETARAIANAFNTQGKVTNILFSCFTAEVVSDDAQTIKSLNIEMRRILDQMEAGVKSLDAAVIREAADASRRVGQMLSVDASEKVKEAIEAARVAAKNIVKASETAAMQIDKQAIEAITVARSAFLDVDTFMNGTEITPLTPVPSRIIDLEAIWAPKPPKLTEEARSAKMAEAI